MVVFLTLSEKYSCVLWFYTGIFLLFMGAATALELCARSSVEVTSQAVAQSAEKRIALTFDDGPSMYTERLLDGLKERQVQASFFLQGQSIQGREKVVERMQKEGHLIGNHTFHHVKLTSLTEREVQEEIEKTSNEIYKVTGCYTSFVRPPYGLWRSEIEYHVTMIPVLWNIDSLDWCNTDVGKIVKKVVSLARDGGIILMHDCYDSSVKSALQIVDELQKENYEFVTVDQLIYE
ncbi:MAG: polysaccharide deacetylase family protein [Lachnospiraceae bacterium]|nr:polysaccharide deacetylase family protein [Lachnospiraceae bacterium]